MYVSASFIASSPKNVYVSPRLGGALRLWRVGWYNNGVLFQRMVSGRTHITYILELAPLTIFRKNTCILHMIEIQNTISLAEHSTFKVGGTAHYFVKVRSVEDLREAAKFVFEKNIPWRVIGEGSNILVSDEGFPGLILVMAIRGIKMKEIDYRRFEIQVGAGENWDDLVSYTVGQKLYGLENLSGIPGSVGAAPVQNIGAYGTEIKEVLSSVDVFDMKTGEVKTLSADDCGLSYRNSFFKKPEASSLVITKISLILERDGRVNIGYKDLKDRFKDRYSKDVSPEEVRAAVLEIREKKLPNWREVGTAGSFFKNPIVSEERYHELLHEYPDMPSFREKGNMVKIPLAWILDKVCDVRGWRRGNVGVHENQSLVLVNYGGATAQEITEAAHYIASLVKEETGIDVEWEVQKV